MSGARPEAEFQDTDIAIVGMAAHVPGASGLEQFWHNLRDGVSSIRHLDEEALRAAGEEPGRMRSPNYVPAAAVLDGFADFDAAFFGFSPKDAAIMDPQHRQFLEVAWEALENAGHPPESIGGPIGVFAGCGMGSYFYFNICTNPDLVNDTGMFLLRHTGNDKDFLATRVSHVFDLKGPSINLQTACSTSLVAAHYACQALQNGECDLALAGGVTIELPHGRGYVYQPGEILSPDGACHAFDHRAQGTVFGSGAGVVALRRLSDAIADGDHVWAVIKGTAVNNDGAAKAGYLAPSVDGQAAAVAEAQALAGVSSDSIGYVECHGTGTYLGDPIEVAALSEAFRETSARTGYCRIGSVKTNIGHLDTAAGAASLIKTALSLHHRQIAPSLGYEAPNPAIDFANSPFQVADRLLDWPAGDTPRRAGVNSLGVGGTNAHAVLQEAPGRAPSEASEWPFQVLTVSGHGKAALEANAANLAAHLRANPDQNLADIAYTLKEGRRGFQHRRVLVAETHDEAATLLETNDPERVFSHDALNGRPEVVFMFPGGGAQYVGMARDLYETEPVFRDWMDRGLAVLGPRLDYDLTALWLAEGEDVAAAEETLRRPSVQLPLIMIVEYALARLWMSWGVAPAVLVGHSMGENTAACLSGVIGFEDCIGLVHLRGQLFDSLEPGGMLSVGMPRDELVELLGDALDIAGVNAADVTVVSGPGAALDALARRLEAQEITCQRIAIDVAAHSRMLEPVLDRFGDYLRGLTLHPPSIPILSNRSGKPLSDAEATDPEYWVAHLRHTVMFADCLSEAARDPARVYLEMGPGRALSSLARMHPAIPGQQVLSVLRHPREDIADDRFFLEVVGRLWALGVEADWSQVWGDARRLRLPLPTYAFQRTTYFIAPGQPVAAEEGASEWLSRIDDIDDWGWRPHWQRRLPDIDFDPETEISEAPRQNWLIFLDRAGLGGALATRLRNAGQKVVTVQAGDSFARLTEDSFTLAPERGRTGYDQLIAALQAADALPDRIAHLWLVTARRDHRPGSSFFHRNLEQGFYSLLFLGQALAEASVPMPLHLACVTSGAMRVQDEALTDPEKATALGPLGVLPREVPGLTASLIDVALPPQDRGAAAALDRLAVRLLDDLLAPGRNLVAALRGPQRFERRMRRLALPPTPAPDVPPLRGDGVYLITGGFGGIGLTIAERILRDTGATVVLLSRRELPPVEQWDAILDAPLQEGSTQVRIRAMRRLQTLGGRVLARAADVSNIAEMQRLREEIEQHCGAVTGVIHAAGVIDDAPMMNKLPSAVEAVFTPKLHGTQVLESVFPDGTLEWLVLFSSTSTVTTPTGQVDYVAANAYLNAYAQSRASDRTRVIALNWGLWSDVGMAAEAIAARDSRPDTTARQPVAAPLLQEAGVDAAGHRVFYATLSQSDWVVDDHRTRAGAALLPGTGYCELAAEALRANGETGAFVLRELLFLRPVGVGPDQPVRLRVRLARTDEGYDLEVESAASVDGRSGWLLHAQARVSMRPPAPPAVVDVDAIAARCAESQTAGDGAALAPAQAAHLDFGARWQVLRSTALGRDEGLARLSLPAVAAQDLDAGYLMHPALMDIATGWAMALIRDYRPDHLWVPVSYGEIRVHGDLPAEVLSWVRGAADNRHDGETARFDVTVMTPDGRVILEVMDFEIHQLRAGAGFDAPAAPRSADLRIDPDSAGPTALSPDAERLRHNLSQGIPAEMGAEAFVRALQAGRPELVVSSLDLDALCAQAEAAARQRATPSVGFARAETGAEFIAPRTAVERTLAGFWQQLLGVDEISVEDNFFDLGGHSLIAVRLFAMIRKTYRIDFPMSVLFEAPTVARCAALIAERLGDGGEADATATTGSGDTGETGDGTAPRFRHLVAMHEGEGGARRPFFLVAGMFGNVLNLRHLAQLIGADRPFYGLQARGLYGQEPPHDDLVQAAGDYIAEMRQVQPRGPYLLGGFSGGGITAYEIAHQLEAAGEEVALLAMLDTPLPQRRPLRRGDRLAIHWQELKAGGMAYPLRWARNRVLWEMGKLRAPAATDDEGGFHNAEIEQAFLGATAAYRMRPWSGRVLLFRPPLVAKWQGMKGALISSERAYVTDDNDWGDWVRDLTVVEVPGDHDSMVLEPNVRVLAAALREELARRDAERPSPSRVSGATPPAQGGTDLKVAE